MISRRDFIKKGSAAAAALSIQSFAGTTLAGFGSAFRRDEEFVSRRPAPGERKFLSSVIEEKILEVKDAIKDKETAWLFENCFPNTLDTTVNYSVMDGRPDTFVITGDIHAMWLRDSTAQVWPYLPFTKDDAKLKDLIAGVINRQTKSILIDPYANAFNFEATGSEWEKDLTAMKPELHERKWEIDSLCYPVRLAYNYWKITGDVNCFDNKWLDAMKLIYKTFVEQQRKGGSGPYKFQRITAWQTDTVAGGGYGNPVKPVGLICSIFRPSDDATIYPFLIPSNYFAVVSLKQMAEMVRTIKGDNLFASECEKLAAEVEAALEEYAPGNHPSAGRIIAYEADGFGNQLFMDDANVPNLLSLPYIGAVPADDELYINTRKFLLSGSNPYFFSGKAAAGIGSPHTGMNLIWPIGIIMRGLTSSDDTEIADCIRMLKNTHAGTGFMHESFHKDNPEQFTRKWFAWANTLFGELILKVYNERPALLQNI